MSTYNTSSMHEEFHEWLEECPVSWTRSTYDSSSSTYIFYNYEEEETVDFVHHNPNHY